MEVLGVGVTKKRRSRLRSALAALSAPVRLWYSLGDSTFCGLVRQSLLVNVVSCRFGNLPWSDPAAQLVLERGLVLRRVFACGGEFVVPR